MRNVDDGADLPLRERKKRATRQRISDTATLLFAARGFDEVTVAEVARAAEVSTMTVFNYFPRKEDLFLDRIPEAVEMFTGAARQRPPGVGLFAALRDLGLELLEQRHPLGGVDDDFPDFWRIVINSPALCARAREGVEELEDALAGVLVEEVGGEGAGIAADPHLTAAVAVAAYRSVYVTSARRLLAGEAAEVVADDHRRRLYAAFDGLERAYAPASEAG